MHDRANASVFHSERPKVVVDEAASSRMLAVSLSLGVPTSHMSYGFMSIRDVLLKVQKSPGLRFYMSSPS